MRKLMGVLVLVSVALVVLCAYLVYASVEQAVSLDHARAAQRGLEQDRAVLQKITVDLAKSGARRADVKAFLAATYATHIVKEEDDTIFVDGVGLRFRGDELVAVVFMDDGDIREGRSSPR